MIYWLQNTLRLGKPGDNPHGRMCKVALHITTYLKRIAKHAYCMFVCPWLPPPPATPTPSISNYGSNDLNCQIYFTSTHSWKCFLEHTNSCLNLPWIHVLSTLNSQPSHPTAAQCGECSFLLSTNYYPPLLYATSWRTKENEIPERR